MTVFKPGGNQYFRALVGKKYGGLHFKDFLTGKVGYIVEDKCAVLLRCSKHRTQGTELQAKDGCNWFYGLLVCYDGFDAELPYAEQSHDVYDIIELMHSDFYKSVREYYKENPSPGLELLEEKEASAWKIPEELSYARKDGVWVGDQYETPAEVNLADDDSSSSSEESS